MTHLEPADRWGGVTRLLANCVVGIGFSRRGFELGLQRGPHLVGCDAGSTDFGPGFLGSGRDPKSRLSVEHDLRTMITGAKRIGVPLVIGSCGGAGGAPHVEGFRAIVGDLARAEGLGLRVALIHAEQDPAAIHGALDDGRITSLGPFPALTHEAIDASTRIVGMMGAGPIMDALDQDVDIVLAGRCADPAIFASMALHHGRPEATAWHAGKSIDKGYLATTTPQRGSPVLATVTDDDFTVEPMLPDAACTSQTVARITMHENPDPFRITQPTGSIVAVDARYEQLDERRVRVTGSRFERSATPTIKLEGARFVGHRAVMIAGLRDPRLLAHLDEFLVDYRTLLEKVVGALGIAPEQWSVRFRSYGNDAVLGDVEPSRGRDLHEVGLVVDVVGDTEDIALAVAGKASATGSRLDFTGHLGGGGNFAYPFSPNVLRGGPVYEWAVWHVLRVDDERAPFELEVVEL